MLQKQGEKQQLDYKSLSLDGLLYIFAQFWEQMNRKSGTITERTTCIVKRKSFAAIISVIGWLRKVCENTHQRSMN